MMHDIKITTGELLDRITILKLKVLANPVKNNGDQLENLLKLWDEINIQDKIKVELLKQELFEVNKYLWSLEDKVRSTENDETLLECAKLIFKNNIKRNSIKKDIDKILKSDFYEEKIYN